MYENIGTMLINRQDETSAWKIQEEWLKHKTGPTNPLLYKQKNK